MNATRVLLDTQVVLWALQNPRRLHGRRSLLEDPMVTRLLSAAVVWEVAIKAGLGRLDLAMPVGDWARRAATDLVAERLPITDEHAAGVADLPPHHRDPFDRLLIAQARALAVPLVSADAALAAYDVEVLTVG
ncbi:MAG: type II toxin-antitoxin system VapC family toxin [Egibacteraceae bacterium]